MFSKISKILCYVENGSKFDYTIGCRAYLVSALVATWISNIKGTNQLTLLLILTTVLFPVVE